MLSQVWAAMHSWFTAPVLFVLVNIVIGSIAVTSARLMRNNNPPPTNDGRPNSMFTRLLSGNFSRRRIYDDDLPWNTFQRQDTMNAEIEADKKEEEPEEEEEKKREEETETVHKEQEEAEKKWNFEAVEAQEPVRIEPEAPVVRIEPESPVLSRRSPHLSKSKSDTPPTGNLRPPPLPTRLKKSGTFESNFGHFGEEMDIIPAFVGSQDKIEDSGNPDSSSTGEVDAKAENFIQKFKQQLKLQRIESLMRYKEMIDRGK
eukprot:Gb_15156 [translate_table: standard]